MRRYQLKSALVQGAAAATALALLTACGGSSQTQASTDSRPTRGGTIVYGHEQEPPCLTGGWVQQAYIARQVLDSLVSQVDNGKIVPWLATAWKVSADQKTWTFTLKKGVKFTDGTPLTADAVRQNFEYWLDPANGNSTVQAYIGEYYESSKATCEKPVGTGPFSVEKWNRGQDITFLRNPNYNSAPANAKHQGPAYVDKIVWKFLHEPTVRYGSLTSGQTNVIYDVPTVNWEDAKSRFQVQQYITPGRPVTLSLNTTKAPFDDVRVRQAFAFATDRESAVRSAFNGVIPYNGNGSLSQSTPDYDASLANAYAHNPAKANSLLDAAGWTGKDSAGYRTKNGKELSFKLVYPAGAVFTSEGATLLQNIQQQVKQVGINAVLVPGTQSEIFAGKYSTPDSYDAITWYWTSPTAGVLYIVWRQNLKNRPNGNNASFYNNPELEKTIGDANSTLDPSKQRALYDQAQQIISDQATAIGLYTQTTSLAISPKLKDVWIEDSQGEPVFDDAYFAQ